MKRYFLLAAILSLTLIWGFLTPVSAQQNRGAVDLIINHYAARDFIAGVITPADLDLIVKAGVRAPSAGNRQPWHFTVVQTQSLASQVLPANVEGNVLILVSAEGDARTNGVQILDCALAVQSINLAAQGLGYGSRIYTGRNNAINGSAALKTQLGLPSGHNVVALVRVGKIQGPVDAVSAASSRKTAQDIVTYK